MTGLEATFDIDKDTQPHWYKYQGSSARNVAYSTTQYTGLMGLNVINSVTPVFIGQLMNGVDVALCEDDGWFYHTYHSGKVLWAYCPTAFILRDGIYYLFGVDLDLDAMTVNACLIEQADMSNLNIMSPEGYEELNSHIFDNVAVGDTLASIGDLDARTKNLRGWSAFAGSSGDINGWESISSPASLFTCNNYSITTLSDSITLPSVTIGTDKDVLHVKVYNGVYFDGDGWTLYFRDSTFITNVRYETIKYSSQTGNEVKYH